MINFISLIAGLALLLKGADLLVSGASSIAARFNVPALVVGLTIVSFGTSLPEMLVSFVAGSRDNADLAIANVIGSNIFNVLVVLGVASIIRPLPISESTVVSEIPFSLIAALLVGFLANAALFSDYPELSISQLDGGILLFFFLLFMLYVYKMSSQSNVGREPETNVLSYTRSSLYICLGVIGLYFGGDMAVDGAVGIATGMGVDDAIIGLTIIAAGTSMPELIASSVAAYKRQTDIAVGNVVGSNIFNLLWVLGFTSSFVELPFEVITNTDLVMVIVSSTLVILALATSRNNSILRMHGLLFVALYLAYLAYVVNR